MSTPAFRRTPVLPRGKVADLWPAEIWPRLLIYTCIVVVALIFMIHLHRHYEFPKSYSLRFFVLLGLLTWWASLSRVKTFANPYAPAFAIWILGAGLSILAAVNMAESLDILYILDIISCYFFTYLTINSVYRIRHLKQGIYIMLIAAIPISIYGFLQVIKKDPLGLVKNGIPVSTLGNQNYASYYHDLAMPIAITFLIYMVLSNLQAMRERQKSGFSLHSTEGVIAFVSILFYIGIGYFHMVKCGSNGNWVAIRLAMYGMITAVLLFWSPPKDWAFLTLLSGSGTEDMEKSAREPGGGRNQLLIQILIVIATGLVVGVATGMLEGKTDGLLWGLAFAAFTGGVLFWSVPRFFQRDFADTNKRQAMITGRTRLIGAGIAVSIVLFFAGCFIFTQTNLFKLMWRKGSNLFRRDIWYETLQKSMDNPILGIGPGNFKVIHPLYESTRERIVLGTEVLGRKAHNDYLEKIAEGGCLVALGVFWLQVLVIWLLWSNINGLLKLRDRLDEGRAPPELAPKLERFYLFSFWLTIGQIGAAIAIGFHAHVEAPLLQPASKVLWTFIMSTIAIQHRFIRRALAVESCKVVSEQIPHQVSFMAGILPVWNHPDFRWILVPILALLIYTPTMRHFLSEALVRQGMGEHEQAEYLRNLGRDSEADYYDNKMFDRFAQANRLYPWYMEDYYVLGRYCIDTGQYAKGIELLLKDIWMNPNYKWAHNNIGVCYDRLASDAKTKEERDQYTKNARLHYYAALEVDPRQIYALFNLAIGYLRTENYRAAIVKLAETLGVDPKKLEAYKYRSIAWDSLAQEETDPIRQKRFKDQARQDIQYYLAKAEPSSVDLLLLRQLAIDYIESGSPSEALPLLQRAEQLRPNDAATLRNLASTYVAIGDLNNAITSLEKLTQQMPRDAKSWYNLAMVLAQTNPLPFDRIFSALRQAFSIDPALAKKAATDTAFESIRDNPDFQALLNAFQ